MPEIVFPINSKKIRNTSRGDLTHITLRINTFALTSKFSAPIVYKIQIDICMCEDILSRRQVEFL